MRFFYFDCWVERGLFVVLNGLFLVVLSLNSHLCADHYLLNPSGKSTDFQNFHSLQLSLPKYLIVCLVNSSCLGCSGLSVLSPPFRGILGSAWIFSSVCLSLRHKAGAIVGLALFAPHSEGSAFFVVWYVMSLCHCFIHFSALVVSGRRIKTQFLLYSLD